MTFMGKFYGLFVLGLVSGCAQTGSTGWLGEKTVAGSGKTPLPVLIAGLAPEGRGFTSTPNQPRAPCDFVDGVEIVYARKDIRTRARKSPSHGSRHTPPLLPVHGVANAGTGTFLVFQEAVGVEEDGDDSEDSEEFDEFDEFGEFDEEVAEEVFDPLSGLNRGVYHFNDKFYCWIWRPAAKGYRFVLPEPVRVAVDKAFKNFRVPARFGNALLQLKMKKAGLELGRFLTNSTIGIGGLFDPADYFFGWHAPSPEDFGQTLGYYGVGGGFPLVLPFLGPSNVRDGLGMIPDSFAHPGVYFVPMWVSVSVTAGDRFNHSSLHIGEYESFKKDALDPYTFFRDLYQQNREKKIEE